MKAKDYAAKYDGTSDSLGKIAYEFTLELGELIKARKVKTDSGTVAILNELNQKWRAFSRLTENVREDGFQIAVSTLMPEVYRYWVKEGIK